MVWGTAVWAVRDGPDGPRVSQISWRRCSIGTDYFLFRFRLCATTAVSSTSETRLLRNGQGTSTATTSPSADLPRYFVGDSCHNLELLNILPNHGLLHVIFWIFKRQVMAVIHRKSVDIVFFLSISLSTSSPKWSKALGPSCSGRGLVSSVLFFFSFWRDTLVGVKVLLFLIKIMYEYDCKLVRFHATCSLSVKFGSI